MTSTLERPPVHRDEEATLKAYDACAAITREASTNFYYAFLTLPAEKRRAIYATYAFCRLCDDIVDDQDRGEDPTAELSKIRAKLASAYAGDESGDVWVAVADAQRRFGIDERHYAAVIEGCEMDITKSRYETFDDLIAYCERVASAVGLVCIEVCGYEDDAAVRHAIDLGIAMQLTNIIRDVAEDAEIGRIYLPLEDLRRFGCSEDDILAGRATSEFRNMMRFQVERAREYFERGRKLFPLLDRRSRVCPQAMAEVYITLLDRVEDANYDVLSERVSLSKKAKFMLAVRLWLRSRIPFLPI